MCENSYLKGPFCVDFAEGLSSIKRPRERYFFLLPLKGVFVANIKICLRQLLISQLSKLNTKDGTIDTFLCNESKITFSTQKPNQLKPYLIFVTGVTGPVTRTPPV